MSASFEAKLARVDETPYRVNMGNDYERRRFPLLYYWNRAERLKQSAEIISDADGPAEVFALLAGLSLELLVKGTLLALDGNYQETHKLHKLCDTAGIDVKGDQRIILKSLSEYIYWASRYPVPKDEKSLRDAVDNVFDKQKRAGGTLANRDIPERAINMENYRALWDMLAPYYHRAREARPESAELNF